VERLASKVLLYMSSQLRAVHDGLALRLGVDLPTCARVVSSIQDALSAQLLGAASSDFDCDPEDAWRAIRSALGDLADVGLRCMMLAEALYETARWHITGALQLLRPAADELVKRLLGTDVGGTLAAFESTIRSKCYARLKEWYIERLKRGREKRTDSPP
jgi:hypothetical protein